MTKTFQAIVEGPIGGPKGDFREVSPPDFEQEIKWDGKSVPDVLILPDGSLLVQRARYLSPGDRYQFIRPQVAKVDRDGNAIAA